MLHINNETNAQHVEDYDTRHQIWWPDGSRCDCRTLVSLWMPFTISRLEVGISSAAKCDDSATQNPHIIFVVNWRPTMDLILCDIFKRMPFWTYT